MSKGKKGGWRAFVCTFFGPGHDGLSDIWIIIIHKTKENPTQREVFWAYPIGYVCT